MLLVSVIIPCLNEGKFIGNCLDSIINQDYPTHKLQVLVVDGISEDATRVTIQRYVTEYSFITLLDNPKKITPCALNIGTKHAKGEIMMRMDAHAIYEKDYISKCLQYLSEYNADNVGGAMVTVPRDNTLIGKAIVLALSSRFGVGNSAFRTGSKEPRWVDTVFGGCYKRKVFEKIGFFNEKLTSTQDMEFNLRLKSAGGKTLLVPEIVSYYYTRSDYKSFCRNNLRNGVWAIYPFKFTSHMPVAWRHLVPLAFVSSLIGSLALWGLSSSSGSSGFLGLLSFVLIAGSYSLCNSYFSAKLAFKEKDWRYLFIMPLIFTSLHIGYGIGSVWGLLKVLMSRRFWRNRFKLSIREGRAGAC